MGYIRNECMVVSGWQKEAVERAHKIAVSIFERNECADLVGAITPHIMNGGSAFLIAPDGSKEGWHHSDIAAEARREFIAYLKGAHDSYLDWALILLGGDDGEYRVMQSPDGPEAESARVA